MAHQGLTDLRGLARQDIDDAGRQADLLHNLGELERGERRVARGLEHDGVTHGDGGRDLPGEHKQGKVPGYDLSNNAYGTVAGQFRGHELRPTGVIVEVTRHERDIDVARLADRLAIVERLQDGEQARMLLYLARQGVEVACAHVPRRRAPLLEGGAGYRDGGIHIGAVGRGNLCQDLASRGIDAVEILAAGRPHPPIRDKQVEGLMLLEPRQRCRGRLWRGTVVHRLKYIHDAHLVTPLL